MFCSTTFRLIFVCFAFLGPVIADGEERPNLILLLADDLSAGMLSCYGGESVQTPALDLLAAEGIRYRFCFSPALCMPSRCELLTGKYSHRNFLGRGNLAASEPTIASKLRELGYATCQIEKWHLNINQGAMPFEAGFDEYYHTKLIHNYTNPVVDVNGEEASFPDGYGPQICQKFAFDFIERHRDEPFFLYYAIHLPHAPYHVPPGYDLEPKSTNQDKYFAMVAHLDERVGKLVEHLELLSLRERTLLIFVGDNGTPKGFRYLSQGQRQEGGKASLLDSGTHVPMIVSWPGKVEKGQVVDHLIDFADFLPTALEMAGLPPLSKQATDGISFYRQLLNDPKAPVRKIAFKFGVQNGGKGAGPSGGYWARTQRWKLYDDGRFYDMRNDPVESESLPMGAARDGGESARLKLRMFLGRSGAEDALKEYRRENKKASTN
ncbi:MAG: sulfatase-like hydrolase/transferase [Verrucomicrobiota bacterium]